MSLGEHRGILVFSEDRSVGLEILSKGRELADTLQADLSYLLAGSKAADQAGEFIAGGADKVYVVEDPALQVFDVDPYTDVLTGLAVQLKPEIILIGGTKRGKELAPRVATRLETGCVTDCIKLDVDRERRLLMMSRLVYGGRAVAVEVCRKKPQIATIPPRTFERKVYGGRKGETLKTTVQVGKPRTETVETRGKAVSGVRLEDAAIIVSGGRGFKSKEDFRLLEELSKVLNAQVGCSRPVAADRGWFTDWVGLSGHKVKPELYVACGIAGVIQHIAGIRDSRIIVAINSNPDAPIFAVADYGIVGDLYEVVPALTEALKKTSGTT